MAKIRPFYAMMNEQFLKFWPPEQDLDVDESMIPYYGKHSAKQFNILEVNQYGLDLNYGV